MRQLQIPALFAATLFAATLFAAALPPLAAAAQDAEAGRDAGTGIANGQTFGDWVVRCDALGVNRTRCMLSQRVARSDDGALLGEILAFWSDDTPAAPMLVAHAPVGVYLPTDFVLQPEGAPDDQRLDFIWQSCNPTICEAVGLPDQARLDQLAAAERLLAGYRLSVGAEATVFPISTKGLAEGLAALKPGAAAAE